MNQQNSGHNSRGALSTHTAKIEANALIELTKEGSCAMRREELHAAVLWETARWLHFQKKLPEINPCLGHLDDLIGNDHFPNRWHQIPESEKALLIRLLIGNQSVGARLLDATRGYAQAARFLEVDEASIAAKKFVSWQNGTPKDKLVRREHTPKHFPMDDGGCVVFLRVFPGIGWGKIADDIVKELEALKLPAIPKKGRSNSNDVGALITVLRGLASLWLKEAGATDATRNEKCIGKTQADKNDYDLLREYERRAASWVASMEGYLYAHNAELNELRASIERDDQESFDAFEKALGQRVDTPTSGSSDG